MARVAEVLLAWLVFAEVGAVDEKKCAQTQGPWLLQHASRRSYQQSQVSVTPTELMHCDAGAALITECLTLEGYDSIVAAVRGELESLDSTCTASNCPQADWAGCVLRMAGHDFMDFANGQGGSDACTDMADADNAGLPACLSSGEHGIALVDVYQQFCREVSLADFLVIAAEAVMMSTRARHLASNPEALPLDFRGRFRFGRATAISCAFAQGRLPNPEEGCNAVEETFLNGMGLTWTEAAALMAVHTLGRAQVGNSGYHGWWSDPENSRRFNNDYYVSLLAKGWIPELAVNGNPGKNQWERSDVGRDASFDGHEMMLNTDLCLVYSENGQGGGPVIATEHDCCAWLTSNTISGAVANNGGVYCGGSPGGGERGRCCGNQANDCGDRNGPTGPAADAVLRFASDEEAWLQSFMAAWLIATENGHSELQPLGACTTTTATTTTTSTTSTTSTTIATIATTATTATTTTTTIGTTTTTPTAPPTQTTSMTTTSATPVMTTSAVTTTSRVQLLRGFRMVDGSDRACRGNGRTRTVSAADVQGCQERCRENNRCRGVSFNAPRCELWEDPIEAGEG
eukprot:Skav218622  [mRNA]  locus=scaffold3208:159753:161471:- [translate_table: standard]